MGKGGAIKKFILDGLARELSSDNDPNFTIGGRYISEKQETTGKPFFLVDGVSGVLAGLEERVSHADGTLNTINSAMEKCADDGPVSCLVEMADGQKYTAAGGVMIVPDDAPGGMMTIREGKLTYSVHPDEGKWIPA